MNYAISGGHQKTLEAAEIVLKQKGNAVDAAIAAYLVSFISEPCMASIGAGGYAMVHDGQKTKLVDFFCQTPKFKKPISQQEFFPITVDFGSTTEDFHIGKGSIAVPGAIAGIYKLHERWGSLPMKELIEPAKLWAKEGVALDKFNAYDVHLLRNIFTRDPKMNSIFFKKNGNLKKEGDIVKMERYSDFLGVLEVEGKDLFYKGEISRQVSSDLKSQGHLCREDFENYTAIVRDPISFDFMNYRIHAPGHPSVGGMILTSCLHSIAKSISKEKINIHTKDHFSLLVQSFEIIQKLKNRPLNLKKYLADQFGITIDIPSNTNGYKWGGTSHFNIIDKNGMTVSLTTSIGEGSSYFIPGTDMQMNNMLGEEALMPNGFHNWQEDERLQSMMSPTVITDSENNIINAIGTGGAGRIPYAIAQVVLNNFYFGLSPTEAINAPRLHVQNGNIDVESGFETQKKDSLSLRIWDTQSLFFGGVNMVYKDGNKFSAAADDRRFGKWIVE